jgi:hypothetical protein
MKRYSFTYLKESEPSKQYSLAVFNESETYLEGISLKSMNEEEKSQFEAILSEYEEKLKPFVSKYYRRFKKSSIQPNSLING